MYVHKTQSLARGVTMPSRDAQKGRHQRQDPNSDAFGTRCKSDEPRANAYQHLSFRSFSRGKNPPVSNADAFPLWGDRAFAALNAWKCIIPECTWAPLTVAQYHYDECNVRPSSTFPALTPPCRDLCAVAAELAQKIS
jgi:hypothetical protein